MEQQRQNSLVSVGFGSLEEAVDVLKKMQLIAKDEYEPVFELGKDKQFIVSIYGRR